MFKVKKEQIGSVLKAQLQGSLDELCSPNLDLGPPQGEMLISCKEISRINSAGIKTWVKYFKEAAIKGVKVTLLECSPQIVEQCSQIINFTAGALVESVYVPYGCEACRHEFVQLFKTSDLKSIFRNMPAVECPNCKAPSQFDDFVDEYFAFLKRA